MYMYVCTMYMNIHVQFISWTVLPYSYICYPWSQLHGLEDHLGYLLLCYWCVLVCSLTTALVSVYSFTLLSSFPLSPTETMHTGCESLRPPDLLMFDGFSVLHIVYNRPIMSSWVSWGFAIEWLDPIPPCMVAVSMATVRLEMVLTCEWELVNISV